jgi:hypothetical protein
MANFRKWKGDRSHNRHRVDAHDIPLRLDDPGEVKTFPTCESDLAIAWVSEQHNPPHRRSQGAFGG